MTEVRIPRIRDRSERNLQSAVIVRWRSRAKRGGTGLLQEGFPHRSRTTTSYPRSARRQQGAGRRASCGPRAVGPPPEIVA